MLRDIESLHSPNLSLRVMYWPLGAPRVYASSRRKRKATTSNDEENEASSVGDEEDAKILGLRVARNGHLFITIAENTLIVWQTNVRISLCNVD